MLIGQGLEKACVLIALDQMFPNEDWGKDFLLDYFQECGSNGFNTNDFYLIEESAPVVVLLDGKYTSTYNQGDPYWSITNRYTLQRYRLAYQRNVIYCYKTGDDVGHAVCAPANVIHSLLFITEYNKLILPKKDLIVDKVKYVW